MAATLLRAAIGALSVGALLFGAEWVTEIVEVLQPDFNEDKAIGNDVLIAQAVVGFLGVAATWFAGASGLAYAGTAARSWLARGGVAVLVAVPLLAVWLFALALPAASS